MSRDRTTGALRQDSAWVTAAEWFAGGQRIPYDPEFARVLTEKEAAEAPGALRVFERVAGAGYDADAVWLTLLPGFPDGSYGWAQVDRMLGDGLGPRLYVEPVGQGDSDKPRDYPYSTVERADLVEALWRHHSASHRRGHLRLHLVGAARGAAPSAGADRFRRHRQASDHGRIHDQRRPVRRRTHPPVAGHAPAAQPAGRPRYETRSPRGFDSGWRRARMYSRSHHPTPAELAELWSAITRRDGAAFLHNAAGFVSEHRRHADRWDLAAIARDAGGTVPFYVGGSDEDPYEHRQISATRERVPQAEVLTFPGGHLTTSEHPDLLAAAIRDIASRHGVGTPAAAHR